MNVVVFCAGVGVAVGGTADVPVACSVTRAVAVLVAEGSNVDSTADANVAVAPVVTPGVLAAVDVGVGEAVAWSAAKSACTVLISATCVA